jgi:glutamate synthase domain-containing protein 3
MALGADEVSFGTPLLIAECCIFCRGCNKGNCPVGIATHDEKKHSERFMRRFGGDMRDVSADIHRYEEARDGIVRYLTCVAEHLRSILAALGLRHPRELVGRVDLLEQRTSGNARWNKLELDELLQNMGGGERAIMNMAAPALEEKTDRTDISIALTNQDRAVGAALAGAIAKQGGLNGNRTISIAAEGFAGQGFAFGATSGMRCKLVGYANDAVAEIMSGSARVTITPPASADKVRTNHLVGNAAAYGATGGTLFVAGTAGQRFGVRNSGATLVCEGTGKYAFEYMTGGVGVILGKSGPCIGSGMTGGELFIYDVDGDARSNLHRDVSASSLTTEDEQRLKEMLGDFFEETKSSRAAAILENWNETSSNFIHVTPRA